MSDGGSTVGEQQPASERITVAQLFGVIGSGDHDADGADYHDVWDALGEAHPRVAAELVEHQQRALDQSDGRNRGTASGSEHPHWHEGLERAKQNSLKEGYDVE